MLILNYWGLFYTCKLVPKWKDTGSNLRPVKVQTTGNTLDCWPVNWSDSLTAGCDFDYAKSLTILRPIVYIQPSQNTLLQDLQCRLQRFDALIFNLSVPHTGQMLQVCSKTVSTGGFGRQIFTWWPWAHCFSFSWIIHESMWTFWLVPMKLDGKNWINHRPHSRWPLGFQSRTKWWPLWPTHFWQEVGFLKYVKSKTDFPICELAKSGTGKSFQLWTKTSI